ncbi:hypothetical protein, partial [Thiocapsa sp.]|uniref:hypothetical protein n=1 Tax=Thiocapsa sp. TaxID=2024551 RepID=UPI002CA07A61
DPVWQRLLGQLSIDRLTSLDSPSSGAFLAHLRFRLPGARPGSESASPPGPHTVIDDTDAKPTTPGFGMAQTKKAVSTEGS